MIGRLLTNAMLGVALAVWAVSAVAQAPEATSFYLLSFEDAPVGEVAEAVVGGALSEAVAVDPAIDVTMSFQAEGAFTAEALLQEFGTAALDAELALVRSSAGDLAVVPRGDLGRELARGGVLVARPELVATASAPEPSVAVPVREPIAYGQARWWDGPVGGLLLFLGGIAIGALGLRGGQVWVLRRRPVAVMTSGRLTYQPTAMAETPPPDPELIIPRFETRDRG